MKNTQITHQNFINFLCRFFHPCKWLSFYFFSVGALAKSTPSPEGIVSINTQFDLTAVFWGIIALLTFIVMILGIVIFRLIKSRNAVKKSLNETAYRLKKSQALVKLTKTNAEKSNHEKIEFLARISHEIRTPMNGILGMAETLSFSEMSLHQQALLSSLNNSAKNLLSLLNDVLDFAKIDAGKLTLEHIPTRLQSLTANIVANFSHVINRDKLSIELHIDESIQHHYHTDPTRLTQVLNNLIDNAIKFTQEGTVKVTVEKVQVSQNITPPAADSAKKDVIDQIKFSVTDAGIGITPQQQEELFSPFKQAAEDTTRKFGGTGLGLTICQEIVNAMSGEIAVESVMGQGSCFSFILALSQAPTDWKAHERRKNSRTLQPKDDQRFKGIRVLVAEDNIVNIAVITAQLERLNIQADIANDGLEALELHKKQPYHIIISDCHMPNMDGFELAQQVTSDIETSALWLIAITADTLNGVKEKCFNAGFNDYLSKPCTQENVTNTMNNAYRKIQHKLKDETHRSN